MTMAGYGVRVNAAASRNSFRNLLSVIPVQAVSEFFLLRS